MPTPDRGRHANLALLSLKRLQGEGLRIRERSSLNPFLAFIKKGPPPL
jgi:hypothetical protein